MTTAEMCQEIISRRVDRALFADGVIETLTECCGGVPRGLISLARQACLEAMVDDKPVIDQSAVQAAIKSSRRDYEVLLSRDQIGLLKRIHRTREIDNDEASGDLTSLAGSSHQLGNVLSYEGRLREAKEAYLKAAQLEQKLGMVGDLALTKYRLGLLYEKMGALQNAEGHLLATIRWFQKEGMTDYEARAWDSLGRVYESRHDADRAQEAYDRAEQIHTSDVAI